MVMDIDPTFGPDDIIGGIHLLLSWPLSGNALIDVRVCPTASEQSSPLCGRGTSDANGRVELGFGTSLEKKRDDDDTRLRAFGLQAPDFGEPLLANARMKNRFEFLAV